MVSYMRRMGAAAAGCLMLAAGPVCLARVATEQIAVGGIGPGATSAYVESVYGQPDRSEQVTSDTGTTYLEYQYGSHFLVGFHENDQTAAYVTCTSDNLTTPGGAAVGMTADILGNVYGQADHLYHYNDKTLYVYDDGQGNSLSFDVQNFYIVSLNARAAT